MTIFWVKSTRHGLEFAAMAAGTMRTKVALRGTRDASIFGKRQSRRSFR